MNTPVGDRPFQDIPRRVAKFCASRPRDVDKSVDRKKKKITRQKMTVFRYRGRL